MPVHSSQRSQGITSFNTALLMGAAFAASLGTGIFTFALPLINLDEKAGGMWLGTVFSGYFLAKLLIAPASGIYADKRGIKTPLLAATIFAAASSLVYAVLPDIKTLYAIQFILGLCSGTVRTLSMAALGQTLQGSQLHKKYALLAAIMNSSFLLGPLLGGILYINKDYLPVLCATSLSMLISFALFLAYRPLPHPSEKIQRRPNPTTRARESYFNIMLALFGRAAGIGGVIAFYPVLLKSTLNLTAAQTGLLYSIPSIASVVLLPLLGRFLSGINRRITSFAGMMLSSLGLFMISSSSGIDGFIFSGLLLGTGSAVSIPASMSLCAELTPEKGKIFGFANMATNLGFMAGPLYCGAMVTAFGGLDSPVRTIAIAGSISALPLLHQGMREIGKRKTAHFATAALGTLLLTTLLLSGSGDNSRNGEAGMFHYSDVAMGTVVNLTLVTQQEHKAERLAKNAVTLMQHLQKDLDHRNRLGSVGRVNHDAGKRGVRVSDAAFRVITKGLEISAKSDGAFDITIGAITTTPFYYALDPRKFAGHRKLINFRVVETTPDKNIVRLPLKGMALDLGGLAKGTIIDAAAADLAKNGIGTALVEAGGDFLAFGNRTWSIGLKNPRGQGLIGTISIKDAAVCGSGDYYQFITPISEDDKIRQHHIFDPDKMQSSAQSIATTAIAPNAETADALATTVFIMGPEKGKKFIAKHYPDCAAMWVLQDMKIESTPKFPEINKVGEPIR